MRATLRDLLKTVGLDALLFSSAEEFLEQRRPEVPSCLILEVRLPGTSGLDLQKQLAEANIHTPTIFITEHGDIPMAVSAMKGGAADFLTKPFRDQDLLDAVQFSLSKDRARRQAAAERVELENRLESLSSRERQLLSLIVAGRSTRDAAAEIGLSEVTVKLYRRNLFKKMKANSLAELFRIAMTLQISHQKV